VIELFVLLVVWFFVFLRWVLGGRGYE